MCDSDSPVANRNECVLLQSFPVLREHFGHQGDAVWNGYIGKPYYASVTGSPEIHQPAEVVVDRDQNPALGRGEFKQCPIARIRFELGGGEDVVAPTAQPLGQAAARAVVDEELHDLVTETAASVSSAITACA